jgi:translation elongation factor EF-G
MKCEYGVACTIFYPQIAFRETVTRHTVFAYTHKEQGPGRDTRTRHETDRANVDDRRQVREEHIAMVLL